MKSTTADVSVPVTACPRCGVLDAPTVSPGRGPHSHKASCAHCGAFLQWVSQRSPEERAARQRHYQLLVMAGRLPTHAQLGYLLDLGYQGAMPATRADAAILIAQFKRGEVAS